MEDVEIEIDDVTQRELEKMAAAQHITLEKLFSKLLTDWIEKEFPKLSK